MKLGGIGLGRTGAHIARRLVENGHAVVGYDRDAAAVARLATYGAAPAASLEDLREKLGQEPIYWLTLPAGDPTEHTIDRLAGPCAKGGVIIDGGNGSYKDAIRRAERLRQVGVAYVDVGTSDGGPGLERGFCMMIGGDKAVIDRLDPIFRALAPRRGTIERTPDRLDQEGANQRVEQVYLHVGPAGAGHFVRMVQNGVGDGLMQAYAEGFDILKGRSSEQLPRDERFDLNLRNIAKVWRRGSVISSRLLDLIAAALASDQKLEQFSGQAADADDARWTIDAAMEEAVPAHVLTAAVFARYRNQVDHNFGEKIVSAMRFGFGGHVEIPQ